MRDAVTSFAERIPVDRVTSQRADEPIAPGVDFRIINAKKDGTRFLNLVHMAPLYDKQGHLIRIVGCQYGLGLMAAPEIIQVFQGVVRPSEEQTSCSDSDESDATVEELQPWVNSYDKRVAMESVSPVLNPREHLISKLEKVMATTIQKVCVSVDWNQINAAATSFHKRMCEADDDRQRPATMPRV